MKQVLLIYSDREPETGAFLRRARAQADGLFDGRYEDAYAAPCTFPALRERLKELLDEDCFVVIVMHEGQLSLEERQWLVATARARERGHFCRTILALGRPQS